MLKLYIRKNYWLLILCFLFSACAIMYWSQYLDLGYVYISKYGLRFSGLSASGYLGVFTLGSFSTAFLLVKSIFKTMK